MPVTGPGPPSPGAHRARSTCSRPRRVHVVAIGGAGMSAIATVLVEQGHRVSGSDQADGAGARAGSVAWASRSTSATIADHVGDAELLVVSTAVPEDNVEVAAARGAGIPVLRRIDLLPALAASAAVRVGLGHPRQDHDHVDAGDRPGRRGRPSRRS